MVDMLSKKFVTLCRLLYLKSMYLRSGGKDGIEVMAFPVQLINCKEVGNGGNEVSWLFMHQNHSMLFGSCGNAVNRLLVHPKLVSVVGRLVGNAVKSLPEQSSR